MRSKSKSSPYRGPFFEGQGVGVSLSHPHRRSSAEVKLGKTDEVRAQTGECDADVTRGLCVVAPFARSTVAVGQRDAAVVHL